MHFVGDGKLNKKSKNILQLIRLFFMHETNQQTHFFDVIITQNVRRHSEGKDNSSYAQAPG